VSKIEETDIKKIAYLARLGIDEKDIPAYAHSLTEILDFVEKMDSTDTSSVNPMAHSQDLEQRLRADVVTEDNQRDLLLKNAPETANGLFLVPKVVE